MEICKHVKDVNTELSQNRDYEQWKLETRVLQRSHPATPRTSPPPTMSPISCSTEFHDSSIPVNDIRDAHGSVKAEGPRRRLINVIGGGPVALGGS